MGYRKKKILARQTDKQWLRRAEDMYGPCQNWHMTLGVTPDMIKRASREIERRRTRSQHILQRTKPPSLSLLGAIPAIWEQALEQSLYATVESSKPCAET